MHFRKLRYFINLYRKVRKTEGHLVSPIQLSTTPRRNRHLSGSDTVKVSKLGVLSSLIFASKCCWETSDLNKMDLELTGNLGLLSPPDTVRGMKHLDRTLFERNVLVPTLKVPRQRIHLILKNKAFSRYLLKFKGIPNVVDPVDNTMKNKDKKVILLDPNIFKTPSDVDVSVMSELETAGVSLESWDTVAITLTYANWNHRDILSAVLPVDSQGVSGFSVIGHIVHLNLKAEFLDYKSIIGEVILDKVKTARTVVNKTGIIDNTFRNFEMEVLAGEEDFITVTQECGAAYQMDFSKVYWNPRLASEHERIIKIFQRGDIVFDMFAGIGPFSIPAAKKKCTVFANDLNPESYKWLNENVKRNKIKDSMCTYNLDGRDFAKNVIAQELPKLLQSESSDKTVHIVMNLPAIALEFTDVFPGLLRGYKSEEVNQEMLPVKVYCHCFSKEKDPKEEIRQSLEQSMGQENVPDFEGVYVRNVAPGKEMFRVMFSLSWSLLTSVSCGSGNGQSDCVVEPPDKKIRTSDI